MSKSPQWENLASHQTQEQSVRQILKEARPESRRLVREVHREKSENGVRGKIARLRGDKTPWNVASDQSL